MEKTATLNLRVNPMVKERAEAVLSKLGVPMSTAIDMYLNADLMTDEQLRAKLREGYTDMEAGRVQNAAAAFEKFGENH